MYIQAAMLGLTALQEIGSTQRAREQGREQAGFYSEALSDLGLAQKTLSESLGSSLALPTLEAQRAADITAERTQVGLEGIRQRQESISEATGFAGAGVDQDALRRARKDYTRRVEDIDISLTKSLGDVLSQFEQQKFEMQSQRQQLEMQKRLAQRQAGTKYFGLFG